MTVGMNVTCPESWKIAHGAGLTLRPAVGFYELLLDNFLHLEPRDVRAEIGDIPISIHIMNSGWANRDPRGLADLAARVRDWCASFEVLYVSDHLLVTADEHGRRLPIVREIDYADPSVAGRAARWQDLLGTTLLLENFASESPRGDGQVPYFRELCEQHGIRILFDASNALIAEQNGGDRWDLWGEPDVRAFVAAGHVSGFRPSDLDPAMLVDTHDCPLDERSRSHVRMMRQQGWLPPTMVVERESVLDAASWLADVRWVGELYA
ncbi:DUF692 family multinuclear iron-containing protein [Nonomuraea sp. B10E15]|uniref:multinuclear nonheme iron-dependent oxidase n=1 Tax=Nonomuraea sp. B10E15 TaxID=3153560 RepID=UPI00325EBC1E